MPHFRTWVANARRVRPIGVALAFSLLSCGREVTGPENGAGIVYARGFSFDAQFPATVTEFAELSAGVVQFDRVRVLLTRTDESIALDRIVTFPAGAASVQPTFDVPLSPDAPAAGETLQLTISYITAAGDTIFRAGPQAVLLVPTRAGQPDPAPVSVTPRYVGVGSGAVAVVLSPDTLTIIAGDPFAFTAVARAADQSVLAGTPVAFRSLQPTMATVTAPNAGSGVTLLSRGYAHIVAQLLTPPADTAVINILPRLGSLIAVTGQNQTAPGGSALTVTVRSMATDGLAIGGIPLTMAVTTGSGSLAVSTGATDTAGLATFSWTLGAAAGAQSLTVSSTGVPNLVFNANSTFAGATQLVVTQHPTGTFTAGIAAAPTVVVEARTAANALDAAFTDTVTLSLGTNPTGATLGGTVLSTAVAGVATFAAWQLQRAGTGYTVVASAPGLASATSSAFNVTASSAAALVLSSGAGQVAEPSAALGAPIVARVNDVYGNGVAGSNVSFAVSAGALSAAAVTTDTAGLASTSWTLGTIVGQQSLTATALGLAGSPLAGSPLTVTAFAAGAIVATAMTPQLATLTAIGATTTLGAISRDAALNIVPTTYTWVSRVPAIATVNSTGLVTSLTNGETYVVATAVGGTRDSARVVVDQQLATIVVAPDARSIYLGAAHAFSAQAVDGLGVALGTQPTFTWTSQATAIGTVTSTGVATGVGLGSTQIRATSGVVTGVATLTVRTPITRIAVIRDSATFVTNDTFTLAALDSTRSYRAVAYDTLNVVMAGIDFAWISSNPSVAQLDSILTQTVRARARANGFTAIRAEAQGVVGSAALNVQQVMTAIDLRLSAATIAPAGISVANPRRLDAKGFALPPGGTFTFASAAPGIATVNPSGVITGIAIGTTTITATSGAITSNVATITVSTSVLPIISFGRDTISIGRSATNQSVPIYLSRPNLTPVTVNLGLVANDTIAFFNPTSIIIPAGNTVGTASLNGRNARTSALFAVDGGGVFAGDTAVLVVQATVSFLSGSYTLITNDQLTTQVRLSDPSPAGGTFVTYSHGTAGRVSISPDPAFIPAGQLSASVVIRAIGAGGTTVTPAATGVNGTAMTVNTSPASLTAGAPSLRLIGAGQSDLSLYVYTLSALFSPLGVTFTPTDSTRVQRSPATTTIAAGSNIAYFNIIGVAPGTGSVVASAAGFTSARTDVVVTPPMVGVCCTGTYNTTSPPIVMTVYAEDSTGGAHYRVNSLNVRLRSSDPSVMEVVTPEVTIAAGNYFDQVGRVRPGGAGGTAWIFAEASGHGADSVQFTVIGPKLEFGFISGRLGSGQRDLNHYVYSPNTVVTPLTVTLTPVDSAAVGLPATVTILAGSNIAYFSVDGLMPGASVIYATAPGYRPDTASYVVTSPRIRLSNADNAASPTTVNNFAAPVTITVFATDTVGTAHYRVQPLVVTYTSSDATVVTVTPADTIDANLYYAQRALVTIVGPGTATITATAVGHGTSVATYRVIAPQLNFSVPAYRIGRRQYRQPTDFYVYTPNVRSVAVPLTITQTLPAVDSLSSTTLQVPVNLNIAYFGLAGLLTGVDTIIVSAPGYLPDTMVVTVTTPRLTVSGLSGGTTTSPPTSVAIYVTDSIGNAHYTLDTLLVSGASSNGAVLQPDSVGFRIPRGGFNSTQRVRFVGPGSASMSYADSLVTGYTGPAITNVVTVTGPSLTFSNSRPMLGMRQNGLGVAAYVIIPNAIGTNLVVNLVSTDPLVASVPASVTIVAGQTLAYVPIVAQDQIGTVQIQASAVGYTGANVTQEVTQPRFVVSTSTSVNTTAPRSPITVLVADANGSAHYANENVTVTLTSSNIAAGTIDSTEVVVLANNYLNGNARLIPGATGTTIITASDARAASYRYNPGTVDVAITTPALLFSFGGTYPLGIGQYTDHYVYTPHSMASLAVTLTHSTGASGTPASVQLTNTNIGYFRLSGVSAGTDLLGAVATGHSSASATISIGLGRVDGFSGWPSAISSASTDSVQVTLYPRAPDGAGRNVLNATTFSATTSNGNLRLVSGGANSVPITSVTVPAEASFVQFWVKGVSPGTATVTFANANYQTFVTPSVTVNP